MSHAHPNIGAQHGRPSLPAADVLKLQKRVAEGERARSRLLAEVRSFVDTHYDDPSMRLVLARIRKALEHITGSGVVQRMHGTDEQRAIASLQTIAQDLNVAMEEGARKDSPERKILRAAIDIAEAGAQSRAVQVQQQRLHTGRAVARIIEAVDGLMEIAKERSPDAMRESIETKQRVIRFAVDAQGILSQLGLPLMPHAEDPALAPLLTQIQGAIDKLQALPIDRLSEADTRRRDLFIGFLRNLARNIPTYKPPKGLKLRINQLKGLRALIDFLGNNGYGASTGYFKQPTGAGKTVFFGVIARLLDVQTLGLVPRTNLLGQTKDELVNSVGMNAHDVGLIGDGANEFGRKNTIATYQSHMRRIKGNPTYRSLIPGYKLVICDEAHRSLGNVTQDSLEIFEVQDETDMTEADEQAESQVLRNIDHLSSAHALKLGFTATPNLMAKSTQHAFGTLIATESYEDLADAGILTRFRIVQVPCSVQRGEIGNLIDEKKEAKIVEREDIYRKLLTRFVEVNGSLPKPLKALACCTNIRECDNFRRIAETEFGLKVDVVTSREYAREPKFNHIKRAERRLSDGSINIVATVNKLMEGWNYVPLDAALLPRASASPAQLLQGPGRAARAYPGKEWTYVFEPVWQVDDAEEREIEERAHRTWGKPKNTKISKKPLSFLDSLHMNGETVEAVCFPINGEPLTYDRLSMLEEDGIAIIDGQECVDSDLYAKSRNLRPTKLQQEIKDTRLRQKGLALRMGRRIPVYRKVEVDALSCVQGRKTVIGLDGRLKPAEMDGHIVVTIPGFSTQCEVEEDVLQSEIDNICLKPAGTVLHRSKLTLAYRAKDLERLPCIKARKDT